MEREEGTGRKGLGGEGPEGRRRAPKRPSRPTQNRTTREHTRAEPSRPRRREARASPTPTAQGGLARARTALLRRQGELLSALLLLLHHLVRWEDCTACLNGANICLKKVKFTQKTPNTQIFQCSFPKSISICVPKFIRILSK